MSNQVAFCLQAFFPPKSDAQKVADLVSISCEVLNYAPWKRMAHRFDLATRAVTSYRDDFESAIRAAAGVLGWTITERKPKQKKGRKRKEASQ